MARWNLDTTHTSAEFSARHMMIATVRGIFSGITGWIEFDEAAPEKSAVEVSIDASTISTHLSDRDNHLRSPDFLDVANYPQITFKSSRVEVTGRNTGKVTGDLTIRGVTRQVVLDAEFIGTEKSLYGDIRAGFTAKTKINREDFGLTWNMALETGGMLVGKEVTINLEVEAIKVAETQPAAV
jgi:polyisoprenoid-binding protein YceI